MLHKLSWIRLLKDSFIYLAFIVAIVAGFLGLFIVDHLLRVKEIVITQAGKEIHLNGLQAYENRNMLLLREDEVADLLQRDNPAIKTISVRKEYPNTLYVAISTRSKVAALVGDMGYYLLADDGTILEKLREEPKNMPIITHYQILPFLNYQAGQNVNFTDIALSLEFYKKFLQVGLKPKSIDIQDYSMIRFTFEDNTQVLVSAEKEKELQWYQIEKLVKDLRIRGERYKLIDVRFEKPYYEQG